MSEKQKIEHKDKVEKRKKKKTSLLRKEDMKTQKESKKTVFQPWERVIISRHCKRPHSGDYIQNLCDEFMEVHGDRVFRDDAAMITGFAMIEGNKFAIIGLEKGKDTEKRLQRNFGMAHPEGYRKALRIMKLAEKFQIPIVCFLDTPGAYPGLSAEERGQGWAIAKNLFEMAQLKTPIIIVLIGEGCSGGALGIGIGDVVGMLEHAYYSVISPEGCASILWADAKKNREAARALKMQAEDLFRLKIIDEIIPEPKGGAHNDPDFVYAKVKQFILQKCEELKNLSYEDLVEKRYLKFRKIGKFANISV